MNKEKNSVPYKRKRWLRWLNILLVIYLLCGVAVYFFQDRFLFHPEKMAANTAYNFPYPNKELNIPLDNNYSMNVVQFLTKDSTPKGVVLFFHGNRKNIDWYAAYAPFFTKNNYEVWVIDYPGFGKSTGDLTEKKLYDFADQLYTLAKSKYSSDRIIIYGKSLGTGIAAWLASKKSCSQVVLETPYYSITSLFSHYLPVYPMSKILKYQLPTYSYLGITNAPVTIFHGTADKVIPYSNAIKLKEVLKPNDHFITIENGEHNNLKEYPQFVQSLDSLLNLHK
ncbi:MAG: alpha/beta fold hydrolase [Agriterribacter sp.]